MDFSLATLQSAAAALLSSGDAKYRAKAQNYRFEEQVSPERLAAFETFCGELAAAQTLEHRHTDYWEELCRYAEIPETFLKSLGPVTHGGLAVEQRIIRIEGIDRVIKEDVEFDALRKAVADKDTLFQEGFLNLLNIKDNRPVFAAFHDDLLDDLGKADWPNVFRDRLGLAHHNPKERPIRIALMCYTVGEVLAGCEDDAVAITKPTVLDSRPWEYYYPAPKDVDYGRAMALTMDRDESSLQAEILHVRMDYKPKHLIKVGRIDRPVPEIDLKDLRNHHLLCLRMESGRDDFGEEMT